YRSSTNEPTINQIAAERYRKAEELVNRNPELSEYIQLGTGSNFTIKPIKRGWFESQQSLDAKLAERQRIVDEIYGRGSTESQRVAGENKAAQEQQLNNQQGGIFEVNGVQYNIPSDQVEEFLREFPNARRR